MTPLKMTHEEKALALIKIDKAMTTRQTYRHVYASDDAIATIAQMMDDAGYYSTNPDTVNPQLIAQVNRLLNSIGATHPLNVFNFARAIVKIADDEDLREQRAAIVAAEEE
ncbi:MAG: hypothetical protein KKB59_14165 [Spirochaetes bacterium]|nr:hypothetical protein [Spirochaetota bacterium]